MSLGPFLSYSPPGVYTRTLTEANAANLTVGLRIPAIVGVGQEELENDNVELVRGSSSTVDQQILNEDVTEQWVVDATNPQNPILGVQTGSIVTFRVKNYPITNGQGTGIITNASNAVTVTVNGVPVAVGAVQGAKGLITLQVPTQPTDTVNVTYYFHRGDTAFTDTVSSQVTSTAAILISPAPESYVVIAGQSDQFTLTVNGVTSTISVGAQTYTAAGLVSAINAAAIANLVASVFTDNDGLNHVQLMTSQNLVVGSGSMNGLLGFSAGQATTRNQAFQMFQRPIVDGSGGGITTTDTSKVVVKVNGTQVIPSSLDGTNGIVTLPFAPAVGTTVTVTYYSNTWQNTFDNLPNALVTNILQCGISTGRNDYIQGTDFVISNPTPTTSVIFWGTSFVAAASSTSPGAQPFDHTLVTGLLVDDQLFMAPCTRVTDTQTVPATVSANQFLLPEVPTTGNGRNTPLGQVLYASVTNTRQDVITNRPDLVKMYVGRSLRDAMSRGTVAVTAVDGPNRLVTLANPVPPDFMAFATFWYSRITDNTFVLTNQVPGSLGTGQYTVLDSNNNTPKYQVLFGAKSGLSETVQWPRGSELIPDAFHTGAGTPVSEVVTVTFGNDTANNASFTNRNAEPYSFYTPYSATWVTNVNGTPASTNLAAQAPAILVGGHVVLSGTTLTIPASPANVLNVNIDGTNYPCTITAGSRTPTQVVTDINTGISTHGTAAFSQIGSSSGDVLFTITSATTPAALPAGFDSVSSVTIQQGTVETVLGFKTFQTAKGTTGAINKPATLLASIAGTYAITAGVNDKFIWSVDGVQYTVQLTAGSAITTAAVVTLINGVSSGVAFSAAGGKLRLTSTINTAKSAVTIGNGTANATLGFVTNQSATQVKVTAQEVVDELMATSGFNTGAVAYVDSINSLNYITFESLTTGAAGSSIGFVAGSNSAFNPTTGIGLTAGVDGDNGEDAVNNFVVSSSFGSGGSQGKGYPGQTYVDAQTGLRFTVLPSSTGSYDSSGTFKLNVSPTFAVSSSIPTYAIPGMETTVSNTVGVGVNDTGTVTTFDPTGVAPGIGDSYYVSYTYMKQDFTTRLFQQQKTIEANFGTVSPSNRVSLASYLAIQNGAVLVGIDQVLKVPNTNQASDSAFITAIKGLATPLPGNVKPDILVPLSTSTSVYAYLTQHCEIQSNIRNQAERMGMIGFASGTSPNAAQAIAKSLTSNRILALYPDSSDITLTDETGQSYDSIVDGTFFAAAVAGSACSPAIDVATPYTRRRIQGFTSIVRILDPVTANQTAVAGVTLLTDLGNGLLRIRQGLTTNMATILTRLPTVTQISDFVQEQSRNNLDSFVGTKFLASRTNEVNVSMTALLKSLVDAQILSAYTGVTSSVDPNDQTTLDFSAYYSPVFPLLYLVLTFNLRSSL